MNSKDTDSEKRAASRHRNFLRGYCLELHEAPAGRQQREEGGERGPARSTLSAKLRPIRRSTSKSATDSLNVRVPRKAMNECDAMQCWAGEFCRRMLPWAPSLTPSSSSSSTRWAGQPSASTLRAPTERSAKSPGQVQRTWVNTPAPLALVRTCGCELEWFKPVGIGDVFRVHLFFRIGTLLEICNLRHRGCWKFICWVSIFSKCTYSRNKKYLGANWIELLVVRYQPSKEWYHRLKIGIPILNTSYF